MAFLPDGHRKDDEQVLVPHHDTKIYIDYSSKYLDLGLAVQNKTRISLREDWTRVPYLFPTCARDGTPVSPYFCSHHLNGQFLNENVVTNVRPLPASYLPAALCFSPRFYPFAFALHDIFIFFPRQPSR